MSKEEKYEIIEPNKNFLNKLINRWDEIGFYLYAPQLATTRSIILTKAMTAFLNRLPNGERNNALKEVYEALVENRVGQGVNPFTQRKEKYFSDYQEVYGIINDYLGQTYFKDFRVAQPKHHGGKLEV